MATTDENLQTAFAGESMANRKYTAYARKAEKEGYPQIARLFRAAAEAETIHALGHLDAMRGVAFTLDNLRDAVKGETYEHEEMYPPMLEQAEADKHRAKRMFKLALKAEKVHADLYQQALDRLEAGKDLEGKTVYLCPVCGHLHIDKPKTFCPICNLPAEKYQKVA